MRSALPGWIQVALIVSFVSQPALAKDVCDAQSTKGDICLCKLSELSSRRRSEWRKCGSRQNKAQSRIIVVGVIVSS